MAYPDDGDPVYERCLETIRSNMEAIATPTYHHDVTKAYVFEGARITLGPHPLVVIIMPQTDTTSGFLSCNRQEHLAQVAIIGTIRLMPNSADWKTQAHWFITDVTVALAADIQLGGDAVFIEPTAQDVFDSGQDTIAIAQVICSLNFRHIPNNPSLTA